MPTLDELVRDLRAAKVFTSKQTVVIENIYIYTHKGRVYKVVVAVIPTMLKKAKRLGLQAQYTTTILEDIPLELPSSVKTNEQNLFILYDLNTHQYSIYPGEESEEEQIKKFRDSHTKVKSKKERHS